MHDFYNTNIIPKILKTFNINNIIVSGLSDENLMDIILKFDATFTQVNTVDDNCIKGNPLDVLLNLENYDAIFVSDDSNWYTVFNELEIIKKTNDEFPLVFICNNNFPNKRRDSYSNPNIIPSNFRHKYTKELPIYYNGEKIVIFDGFFHACEENTPQNGVLTAIEDFLNENSHIGMMKISFIKEICVLYPKSQINEKRISIINNDIQNDKIKKINFSDKLIENQLLISYINEYELHDENLTDLMVEMSRKDAVIDDFENKIKTQNNEINFKNSQLSGIQSKLSLKDSQIRNIESKLVNKDRKIHNLESQLSSVNDELNSLNQKHNESNNNINILNQEIDDKDVEINELTKDLKQKESDYNNQIYLLKNEINQQEQNLINIENKYGELIKIKDNEIDFFKNDLNQKESEYNDQIYLLNQEINQQEQNLLNYEQKDAQFKSQQQELNSLKHSYTKQMSKIENKEYCIGCYKDEILNNHLEINYLKKHNLTKNFLNPLSYIYLLLKSNPKEISLNIKLYRALKDSDCFDIGFYLNNNQDLIESKWCKYLSPELHYVCNGFSEKRKFNKKYFNRNSKKELLDYIINCP